MKNKIQPSDCLLVNACKEFYHGKKHNEKCDAFMEFICEQANCDGEYADKIRAKLGNERFILKRFLFIENWNNLFKYIYGSIELCLTVFGQGDLDRSIQLFFAWHDFVYNSAANVAAE